MNDDRHDVTITSNQYSVISLECSCGWIMERPGKFLDRYEPWAVREIVDISNAHLTEATT